MGTALLIILTLMMFGTNSVAAQVTNQAAGKSSTVTVKKKPTSKPNQGNQEPLDFSDTGRPGQQTAGESRGNCDRFAAPLEALIPASHSGKTVSAHPSFWVYFPYNAAQIERVEFVLQNEAREDIWRSSHLPSQPKLNSQSNQVLGYQRFTLPSNAPALAVGRWYRWYIKVYCPTQTASAQYVQGWVKRVPVTSQLYLTLQENQADRKTYASYGIWYDALDSLLSTYQNQPSNLTLEQEWRNLIEARGVELPTLPIIKSTYEAAK